LLQGIGLGIVSLRLWNLLKLQERLFHYTLDKMPELRPPRNFVQFVIVHNEIDAEDRWVGMKLEWGSWVTLSARRSGPWDNWDNTALAGGSSM
jgi:hypothetical protein